MLSMSNVTSVANAASYYAEDNYYSQEESTAMSAWAGRGAEHLGLLGPVDPADFARILSGEVAGEKLGKILGKGPDGEFLREHRPGLDVTLSPPKSVSIVAEIGGSGDVRFAHEAAVSKVLEYIQNNLIGARVTEGRATRFEATGNAVVARFAHTTSRDLDPQTHTHLVIANATLTAGGHWRSVSNESIYQHQHLLGNIYDSELAANLRAKGYRLESTQDGRWEIAGITREQIEHFSQRSQAISERLEKFGLTRQTATGAQREDAALRTRDPKMVVDHTVLRAEWQERAAALGVDFAAIEAARDDRGKRSAVPPAAADKAEDAVRFALAHLTERESVVGREELLNTALAHAVKESVWAGVRLDALQAALDEQVKRQVALVTPAGGIATADSLERERVMLRLLESGRDAVAPVMAQERIGAVVAAYENARTMRDGAEFRLSAGQENALRTALGSTDRFVALQGYAGAGKTTMLELLRTTAEEAGYTLRGMAPSAEAALTLQAETGIPSVTSARFLVDQNRSLAEAARPSYVELFGAIDLKGVQQRRWLIELAPSAAGAPHRKEIWVMDEASLAGQREMTTLMGMARAGGARLVLVGDRLQLNAVEGGKPFELLQKHGIHRAEMTEINRQKVADLQRAVAASVQRNNAKAFRLLEQRVVEVPDKEHLLSRIANDVLAKDQAARANALLIVPLNADRLAINALVRAGLQKSGAIGEDVFERAVLVPTGFTDAQKQSTAYYAPGLVVRFGRTYRSLHVERGQYASVVSVDRPGHIVMLRTAGCRQVVWSPEKHANVEVYEAEKRAVAVGDELRFTRNQVDLGVTNGTLGRITEVASGGLVLKTKAGKLTLQDNDLGHAHWDYAHAMTVYTSQGKTSESVNFLISADSGKAMGERAFYVGITRPRADMTIYTDSRTAALKLIQAVQEKTSVVEELKDGALKSGQRVDDDAGTTSKGSGSDRSLGAEL